MTMKLPKSDWELLVEATRNLSQLIVDIAERNSETHELIMPSTLAANAGLLALRTIEMVSKCMTEILPSTVSDATEELRKRGMIR